MQFSNIKISCSLIYRAFTTIFCSVCLIYQFSQLLSKYQSGKTVVNIDVKRELYENLPAITVCLPQIVSFEALANYSQEYREDYEFVKEWLSEKYLCNPTLYKEIDSKLTTLFINAHKSLLNFMPNENFFQLIIDNLSLPYDEQYLSVEINGNLQGNIDKMKNVTVKY